MRGQEEIVQFTKRNQPDKSLKELMSTPDRISTKTDKSKLLHGLQSHIKPTICHTTEDNSFTCHLQGSDGTSIQPGTKDRACWFCHYV